MEKISGKVISGIQKGRTLGFPTANILTDSKLESGIYAGYFFVDGKKYNAAIYSPESGAIEVFVIDYSGDLYGKEAEVEVLKKIRDKKNFKNDSEAIEQIKKDVLEIKKYLLR